VGIPVAADSESAITL